MLRGMFGNMQPVVKNLLIINGLFFLATIVLANRNIDLVNELGLYYPDSVFFRPYQLATHFFMHGGFRHIIFNMLALVVFGNMLERVWGSKKFLLYFFATALGAAFVHIGAEAFQIYQLAGTLTPVSGDWVNAAAGMSDVKQAAMLMNSPAVGASGAVYGLIIAAALYFPNTELYVYAVLPVKIKWLAVLAIAFDVISVFQNNPDDHTAHFAHLGGALIGFIIVYFWKKNSTTFY
ncbi:MAG: rhomboid family intramembrane serine protease [Crocinitomicaceae bacterium]